MTDQKSITQGEPALTTGTITGLIGAAILLLVSFGLNLSQDQIIAITGFVAVVAPIVSGIITRRQVVPTGSVAVSANASGELVAGDALSGVETGDPVTTPVAL